MSKKPEDAAPAGTPAWMLTFADTVTLLMTFFVLLYTFRGVEGDKFADVIGAIRMSLSLFKGGGMGDSFVPPGQNREGQTHQGGAETAPTFDALRNVEADFRICAESPGLAEYVDFTQIDRGLLIRIRPEVLFDSGSASLKGADSPVLKGIAASLRKLPHVILVTAHGDRFFLPSARYTTNQELAMERAAAICVQLNRQGRIEAQRLQACAGGAEMDASGAIVEIMILTAKPGGFHL